MYTESAIDNVTALAVFTPPLGSNRGNSTCTRATGRTTRRAISRCLVRRYVIAAHNHVPVASRSEVERPRANNVRDRNANGNFLVKWFIKVRDIIRDDVCARRAQQRGYCRRIAYCPLKAEAKESCAPGARSWTICSIARPSSVLPVVARLGEITLTGVRNPHGLPTPGRSPDATSLLAWVTAVAFWSYESDKMPTLTPVPSILYVEHADAAFNCVSPPRDRRALRTVCQWSVCFLLQPNRRDGIRRRSVANHRR